ncbi:hypothetical protein AcV7_006231 [Taiwanofungus camphoratus]|nr:hypothetical protein AcV7_006231 [Antrodia cinnamomea]
MNRDESRTTNEDENLPLRYPVQMVLSGGYGSGMGPGIGVTTARLAELAHVSTMQAAANNLHYESD